VQNAVDARDLGVVSSSVNFFRSMGGSIGVAAFGAVFSAHVASDLAHRLPAGARLGGRDVAQLAQSPAKIRALPAPISHVMIDAIARGVHLVFLWAIPVALAGLVLALVLREVPLRESAPIDLVGMAGDDAAGVEVATALSG
jgi:hypothetical protein